ncbi:glycerol kinase GlpK [Alteromonas gilva]|uniref:Glycerol kinase GlpK n=1 Tax=Alteromonas gilva TaxID=2987522 RepID=A0ABT5KYZ8_9ALTE|nr:glycerol kinase GlpK [Alteromonas gilva]MDC8829481.1 glycerol kinase GlpK [Alteromonas gilva]
MTSKTNSNRAYLAIDQGTTSSRAIVFTAEFEMAYTAQQEFAQYYPRNGWVEQDPEELWQSVLAVTREALAAARQQGLQVTHIGIVNQRETTLVWHRDSGKPVYNAIVWQDRRTSQYCRSLSAHEDMVQQKTGLRLDPYFSASKLRWILDNVDGANALAQNEKLLFGTVDSWLIWRLTGGEVHATDVTNASRTSLYNIGENCWDNALLALFGIPPAMLPEVKDCAADFGMTAPDILPESLPISGVAGDQQAAMIGQGCVQPGNVKATYGTGCFALVNTGADCPVSQSGLLTTIAYRLHGQTHYAIEGAIFVAGAAVQWLRDGLGLIAKAADSEAIASQVGNEHGLVVVPAFTGLGAPHWQPDARGAIYGITRATSADDIVRATLESVCFQTHDLLTAMSQSGVTPTGLKVDGGMVANEWFCQFLADTLNVPVVRPHIMETTALGAALLAAMQAGDIAGLNDLATATPCQKTFTPTANSDRETQLVRWQKAVQATLLMAQ